MTPTPKLRWIEREHEVGITGMMVHIETVLQQWWAPEGSTENEIRFELNGEWRDVPLEKEQ